MTNTKININQRTFETCGPTASGVSKVDRYKWRPLGPAGEFTMIAKDELHVDHTYQRDKVNENRINDIAANWDWVMCGALSVAERDEKWFVMDGQHRKLAADKRIDIKALPCMVFPLESKQKEAGIFVGLNSQKTAVAGIDRFKAMIVAGDKSAIGLNTIIQSTGHKVCNSRSGKGVSCILCLWKMYKRDENQFRDIWPLIVDICSAGQIVDCLVRGIWGCEIRARDKSLTLTAPPYRAALMQSGGAVIAAEIRREVGIAGKGGERIETMAVLKWINRQRLGSKYKLPI